MKKTLVLNIVGLSEELIGENTPFIKKFAAKGSAHGIEHIDPAVTCSVQSSYLTGLPVSEHGIVGNGWYNKELAEVMFWKQSNHLVNGEMVWEAAKKRDPSATCAQLFWWYNMYSTADWSVTPRPMYPADGRKIPDIYASTDELRHELNNKLGQFPLFNFWGPKANIKSSQWIADCALYIQEKFNPNLNLVYLPHLDYPLQKFGPGSKEVLAALREIDKVVQKLCKKIKVDEVIMLSEYSISKVDHVCFPNRELRELGFIKLKIDQGLEYLDAGACDAFAVCDHQVAHIYCKDQKLQMTIVEHFKNLEGISRVLIGSEKQAAGLDHSRAGDIILVSHSNSWFSYYYWLDDMLAPDFARTVDIHRKPGYDPVELFVDPKLKFPILHILFKLIKKKLGFRQLMDIIPIDASLVKGSHGAKPKSDNRSVFLSSKNLAEGKTISPYDIKELILKSLFD